MGSLRVPRTTGVVTAVRAYRLPVHERIFVQTSGGHEVGVDHVYWASYLEAQLAPRRSAPKAAARLLRRCCERLVLPEVALGEACYLLNELIAEAVVCTHRAVRVELSADRRAIRMRVTARGTAPVDVGGFAPAPARADVTRADRSSDAWTVSRSDSVTVFSTVVALPSVDLSDLAS